jgi:hypothetical protein
MSIWNRIRSLFSNAPQPIVADAIIWHPAPNTPPATVSVQFFRADGRTMSVIVDPQRYDLRLIAAFFNGEQPPVTPQNGEGTGDGVSA